MAKTILSSNHHDHKPFYVLGLFSVLLSIQEGGAHEFKVGDSNGWAVPAYPSVYNQWAENNRFQISDTLVFEYPAEKDSVLQVTKKDYTNCNTASPMREFKDNGHTVFKFDQSGPFYFISGVEENCVKNEKLVVVVMADRSGSSSSIFKCFVGSIVGALLGSSLLAF
ncbi:early nodulin-like protein 9 [Actinidia rufa]|uniref:Early nodulin-like protein 9 n=1 Tax=Actinidia rufa TaxID=165716 RepID=A0A7J0GNU5_9ERIC|nr:early nodulin-like protein 9 [Actinidia rufa]